MKKLINILIISFIIISTVINLYFIYNLDRLVNERLEVLDIERDVIVMDSLVYDTMYLTKTEVVRLPIVNTDTVKQTDTVVAVAVDSVFVEIPIEYKHYSDTLAETAISFDLRGFQCEVNNLYVENFLNVPTQENKQKRWYKDINIGIGFGITYVDKFRIVPNVGIYYKLL